MTRKILSAFILALCIAYAVTINSQTGLTQKDVFFMLMGAVAAFAIYRIKYMEGNIAWLETQIYKMHTRHQLSQLFRGKSEEELRSMKGEDISKHLKKTLEEQL